MLDAIDGADLHLFGAHPELAMRGRPGDVIARHGEICRATVDGAVWITHLKPAGYAVIELGHALNLSATAEGVETDEQLGELQLAGCDTAQGSSSVAP